MISRYKQCGVTTPHFFIGKSLLEETMRKDKYWHNKGPLTANNGIYRDSLNQPTFQRCFSALLLAWNDVATLNKVKPKVETTLYMSTLKFTTLNNFKSMLSISTLILAMSDNVKTTLRFSTLSSTAWTSLETTLWMWAFAKGRKIKLELRAVKYFWALNKNHLELNTLNLKFWLLFQFILRFNRNKEKNICKGAKFLTRENVLYYKNGI